MPLRVNFICDEFSSMPPMNMSHKIQVARSRNIRFFLVLQDFDQLKETYKEQAGTIKSNCTNWIYLLTADNETAREISARLGKYTISSERISTSGRVEQSDYNISNDKSLIGRELMMPDELMRFQFGEAIFMGTRMNPIKAKIIPISKYPIKYKVVSLPNAPREYKIECFNLDEFRKNNILKELDVKIDLE